MRGTAICDAFQINRYHILHFSAHGRPGVLYPETADGGVDEVAADAFVAFFPVGRQPTPAVLSACHSGAMGELAGFAGAII